MYTIAQMGLKSMDNFIKASGEKLDQEGAREIIDFLFEEIPGHIWEGKEAMFTPFIGLCKECESLQNEDIVDIIFFLQQQIIRKNVTFQIAALGCLTEVIEAWKKPDQVELLATTLPLLDSILSEKIKLLEG